MCNPKELYITVVYYFCIDILIGLLRLRKCSKDTFRPELKGGVSIVRELHVYPLLLIIVKERGED